MSGMPRHGAIAVAALAAVAGCGADSIAPRHEVLDHAQFAFARSEWSDPMNVGAPVNSAANEMNAALSPDELSLYFTSDRPGGLGLTDIWVARRDCVDCPWQEPANLGAPFNSASQDAGPRLSNDGHLLFFQSDRPVEGSTGGDIYMARRSDTNDDFAWGTPVRLGPGVNKPDATENAAAYLQSAEDGRGNLYFNRNVPGTAPDLYVGAITREGETVGEAVPVPELNMPGASNDQHATVRNDGREIFFSSNRPGGFGSFDVYTSTRRSVHEPWSAPSNMGPPINTTALDLQPSLSHDARTLLFASGRPGGLGGNDLYVVTRTPSGQ